MTITNPLGRIRTQSKEPAISPVLVLTGALAAIVTVTALSHHTVPADAFLPAVSTLFFITSAAVAATAWFHPMPPQRFSYWDAAGVLTALGICVAAGVEPEQMVRLFAGPERSP